MADEIRGLLVAALLADLAEHPTLPAKSPEPGASTPSTVETPRGYARTLAALPASPGPSPRRPRSRAAQAGTRPA